jgi:predicted phosphodiesterase
VEAIRGATRRALSNLVSLCLEERARLLLVAGDVYDGDWRDYSTGLFFAAELLRLREGGCRVAMVRGNHDAVSQVTRNLRLPEHVAELPAARPGTLRFEELGVAVHGQSYKDRAVQEDMTSGYPSPAPGVLNVGLLHTALTGRPGHAPYAPTTPEILATRGYDYWALGHVHQREVVREDPWVVFPGNLQGRHVRETGQKGATVIETENGRIQSVEHRSLDVVRWVQCDVDGSVAASPDDVVELARAALEREVAGAEGRIVAARVVVRGHTRAHAALLQGAEAWAAQIRTDASALSDELWVEKVKLETCAELDVAALGLRDDAVGQVARALALLRREPETRAELAETLSDLRGKLPPEAREGIDAIRLDDPDFLDGVLGDVEQILLPALASLGTEES